MLLRQLLLTNRIVDAVKTKVPTFDQTNFRMSHLDPGFVLHKMNTMMGHNANTYNKLLKDEPVKVTAAINPKSGKKAAIKIDEVMKPAYDIIDGRHRVTRAIIEGRKTILVSTDEPPKENVKPTENEKKTKAA